MTSEAISDTRGHKKSLVRFVVLAGLPVIYCALQRRDVSTQTAGHQPPFLILLVGVLWLLLSGLQQTPLETSVRALSAENGSTRSALAVPAAEASARRGALLSSDD